MDETRPRRSETRVRDEAASARVMMDSNLCEFLFFFFFSFLFSCPSSSNLRVHGQKKIASLPRISGSRTCAHAQFMQVGIRGWKVAPIDSNFSSSFVKIIPRLVEGRRFRRRKARIFGIITDIQNPSAFFFKTAHGIQFHRWARVRVRHANVWKVIKLSRIILTTVLIALAGSLLRILPLHVHAFLFPATDRLRATIFPRLADPE